MRFFGLVAVVVIAIFAGAFGVYHWLDGRSDTSVQVVEQPALPAASPSDSPGSGSGSGSAGDVSQTAPTSRDADPAETAAVGEDAQEAEGADADAGGLKLDEPQPSPVEPNPVETDLTATNRDEPAAPEAAPEPEATEETVTPNLSAPQVVARVIEKATGGTGRPQAGEVPAFDVVRVEKSGEAILAGRAPAGSEVTIYDGDTPLGIVTADARGQWVLILDVPLMPGSHSLGITARLADDTRVESSELVIVAVPEPEAPLLTAENTEAGEEAGLSDLAAELDADGAVAADREDGEQGDTASASGNADDSADSPGSPVAPSQLAAADTGLEEPIAVVVPRHGAGPARILQQPGTEGEGIGNGSLILDSVDYDDDGRAVIGGRANAGAALIVYLDNIPVGEALTGEDGRWVMTPEDLVPVGLHRLRVDQIESDGRVLARVETPFSRADTIASHPDENFVTVQPGNSLWRIARTTYGQGTRYTVIYETNKEQIRDPDLIYPGQIFRLPSDG